MEGGHSPFKINSRAIAPANPNSHHNPSLEEQSIGTSFLGPRNSIFSAQKHTKKEIVTQEDMEKVVKEINKAKDQIVFPDNP